MNAIVANAIGAVRNAGFKFHKGDKVRVTGGPLKSLVSLGIVEDACKEGDGTNSYTLRGWPKVMVDEKNLAANAIAARNGKIAVRNGEYESDLVSVAQAMKGFDTELKSLTAKIQSLVPAAKGLKKRINDVRNGLHGSDSELQKEKTYGLAITAWKNLRDSASKYRNAIDDLLDPFSAFNF